MSNSTVSSRWLRPMRSRDPQESPRTATPLELFFDLCFVVAIAFAAQELHHGMAHGHVWESLRGYGLVFFAIWWAWMSFTWFASAYDTDDPPYRVAVFVQMTGVLILAAGVPRAFEHQDFAVITLGYAVMRVALIALWLRAARAGRSCRRRCLHRGGPGRGRFVFHTLAGVDRRTRAPDSGLDADLARPRSTVTQETCLKYC